MSNPFNILRRGTMAKSPVDRSSMDEFNPAVDEMPYPFRPPPIAPEPEPLPSKRFATGINPSRPGAQININERPLGQARPMPYIDRPDLDFAGPTQGMDPNPQVQAGLFFDQMQKMRENRPERSAYMEAVSNQPKREEYEPSKWRRLAAIIGGAAGGYAEGPGAGILTAGTILDQPYRRTMSEYERRVAGLKERADLEAQELDDKISDIKTAHDLGIKYGELGYKGQELDIQRGTLGVRQAQARTEWQDTLSKIEERNAQIDRLLAQTHNEDEVRALTKERDRNTALYQQGMVEAAKGQAGAAGARAGHYGRWVDKYVPGGSRSDPRWSASDIKSAEQQALQALALQYPELERQGIIGRDPRGYRLNTEEAGDWKGVQPVQEMYDKMLEEKLQDMLRNKQGGATEIPEAPGPNPWEPYNPPNQ